MLRGTIVLAAMAAIWCELGLLLTQAPFAWFAGPLIVSLAVVLAARAAFRSVPPRSDAEERRVGRIMRDCIVIEAIGITVTASILATTGRNFFIPDAIAIVVGLHFLPMAWRLPLQLYYATAAAMLLAGLLDMLEPAVFGIRVLCVTCGMVLWATCCVRVATRT